MLGLGISRRMGASRRAMWRTVRLGRLAQRPAVISPCAAPRFYSSAPQNSSPRRRGKALTYTTLLAAVAGGIYYYSKVSASSTATEGSSGPVKAELAFEDAREQPSSKEDNRDLISSQHMQVKNSWEHPGVHAWGSNIGKVVDPKSKEKYVKLPRRIAYFNDQILRDLKLTQNFGAAITKQGDLVQWGLGFSKVDPSPQPTLRGKNLVKVEVSADRVLALSKCGDVFSILVSRDDQQYGLKEENSSTSWSLWRSGGKEKVSFRTITPKDLGRGERVKDISSGLEHCLLLTSRGRVFSAASSTASFPSRGQMGVPGLNWETRPQGPYDQAHEIPSLKGFKVTQIAAGDQHSVVLDQIGRIFSFGDNTNGQLGFEPEMGSVCVSMPSMVSVNKLYANAGLMPAVTGIAAGGNSTFFTVDAQLPKGESVTRSTAPARRMPRGVTDLWACGEGVLGALGTGKWTHVSVKPTKVNALSSLFEFDEQANQMRPIKLRELSIGMTHCAAVMDNVTETNISHHSTANETNWGADVLFWGGNEYYQLGTGKRSNVNAPTYVGPLDGGEADADKGRKGEMYRMCITPRVTTRIGEGSKGRKVSLEQKVECGRYVTSVYSAV